MILWLAGQIRAMFEDVESLFVEGRLAPDSRPPRAERQAPPKKAQSNYPEQPDPWVANAPLPDWMQPAPSENPRKALPMEVVAALMAIGLASPPAKEQLRRRIRRALADAHPDRHPAERHAEMARRLHEIQDARAVLRRHGFA